MDEKRRRPRWITPCAVALLFACGRTPAPQSAAPAVYVVRGRIVERSGKAQDARAVVAHQAIPRFQDRDGRAARMPAMTMAFGIGPGVDASALVPDSKWELTFQVNWNREPSLLITAAKALPSDAQLVLGPASK